MNINQERLINIDYAEAERRILIAHQLARETGEPVITAVQYTGRPDFPPIIDYTNLMRDDSEWQQQWNRRVEEEQALPPGLEWLETDLGIGQSVYVRLTPPSISRIVSRNPSGSDPDLGLHLGTVIDRVISDFGREKNYLIRIPDGTLLRLTEESIVDGNGYHAPVAGQQADAPVEPRPLPLELNIGDEVRVAGHESTGSTKGIAVPAPIERNSFPRKNRYQILLEKSHE